MRRIKMRVLSFLISIVMVMMAVSEMSLAVCANELQTSKEYEEFTTSINGSGVITNPDYGFIGSDFEISFDRRYVTIKEENTEMRTNGIMGFCANDNEPEIGKILLDVESNHGEPAVGFYYSEEVSLTHKVIDNGNGKYTLICEIPEDVYYIVMKNTGMDMFYVTKAVVVRRGKTYPYEPTQEEPKPQESKPENISKPGNFVQSQGIHRNATVNRITYLRKKATTRSKALMKVKKGQKVQIVTRNRKWYKVRVGNKTGYIRARYVSWKGRLVSTRKSGNVYLKGKARTSSRTVGRYKNGTKVKVIDCNGKWYKVKIGKKTGYMKIKQITPIS